MAEIRLEDMEELQIVNVTKSAQKIKVEDVEHHGGIAFTILILILSTKEV